MRAWSYQPASENRAICSPQTHRWVKHPAKPSLNQTGFLSPANQTPHLRDPSVTRPPGPQQGRSWVPSTAEIPVLHTPCHAGAQQGWGQTHAWHLQHGRLRSSALPRAPGLTRGFFPAPLCPSHTEPAGVGTSWPAAAPRPREHLSGLRGAEPTLSQCSLVSLSSDF